MADVDFEDFDDGYGAADGRTEARGLQPSRLVNIAGAVSSVALVIGLGVWGYKLAVRDVNGIPVVRALEGPMRMAPANPGGEVAAHQGLAVNDVAALGAAAPPPEQLILAPRPVELTDEDAAAEDLNGAAPATPLQDTALAPVVAPVAPLAATEGGADADAVAKALAEALAADPDAASIEEDVGSVDTTLAATDVATPETAAPEAAAAAPSTRPLARPASFGAASVATDPAATDTAPALAETAAPPPVVEVDPSAIPVGTRLVQLGAFDTADQARGEWLKLTNQFGPAFAGKAMVVQSAESGGSTFFRLRAHGFADEAETRSFCLTLLEQNAACIPVEQR
ncbi:SPOR domain-containing protein [Paragemmobacter straminiformis]|uniref:SPOR domain-containing protein n=1 Tax=Paragemmobacter straminiformis TaxID=2045119 RepID=A0A842I942_9RHOB|nr:SPOR domain-containing protein [Gemmobacter straminiformis]MBC2835594.1 SPOR domain-containing protein [Gemmobacter straminiformis]